MSHDLLMVTMNSYQAGRVINVDGQRFRIVRVLSWTGTVARLEIEQIPADAPASPRKDDQ